MSLYNCVKIMPSSLSGSIKTPPSKSLCHRAIIAAGLADGKSLISNIGVSKDIEATCGAMKALGVSIDKDGSSLIVKGNGKLNTISSEINCIESGSTLRFLIPVALMTGDKIKFTGQGRLFKRPLKPYYDIFEKQNIFYSNEYSNSLIVKGKIKPDVFEIEGNISSQFISGLLFALPVLHGDSKIVITTDMESKGYVDLTIDVLKKFSVKVTNDNYRQFIIKGNQKYKPFDYRVDGDFSQAAFWIAAGILDNRNKEGITCTDLDVNSIQDDKKIVDIVEKMGGKILKGSGFIKAMPSHTKGIDIDVRECPDIVPILAVLGALSCGTTRILNAGRLRLKESDRLKAISSQLNKLGANVMEGKDYLVIKGKNELDGGKVESFNDHRIAMALSIASIRCKNPVVIKNSNCVEKSYPEFFEDFIKLGGNVDEWNLG